jgi:phospholipase C
MADYPEHGTIFDLLSKHDISWVNYHPIAGGKTGLRAALRHRRRMLRRRLRSLRALNPSSLAQLGKDMQFTADIYPLGIARYMKHVRGTEQFFTDADEGTLPAFSLVDPDFKAYSEENPQDVKKGESFASEVVRRVTHGKGWANTLLIWLYDEHGGYYDHVPPPAAVEPDDVPGRSVLSRATWQHAVLRVLAPGYVKKAQLMDGGAKRYDRYGFRVPAVLVSPYARPDYVSSQTFDHTSVLKLVEEKWNLPPLTARDAAAVSPIDALDFDHPPAFAKPPELPEPALRWGSWPAEV